MDKERVAKAAESLEGPETYPFESTEQIDEYTAYLMSFIERVMEEEV